MSRLPNKRLKLTHKLGGIALPRRRAFFLCAFTSLHPRALRPQLKRDPLSGGSAVIRVLCSTLALLHCASFSAAQQAGSATGRLRGRVLTGVDSSALAGAIVSLDNRRVTALTDSSGRFEIDTIAVGVHSLTARYIQYNDSERS